jgi:nitric oxide dioxygenase
MRRLCARFYPNSGVAHRKWRGKGINRSLSLRHALRPLARLAARAVAQGRVSVPQSRGGNIVNAAQQELARATFARLAVMPEVAGALFYERLFAISPSFRPLFKNDMRVQGVKLMTMLAMVVYNLPESGQVLPAIRDLAVRHVNYGVKLADYDAMRDALLWTFEQALGEDFTPAVREAWTVCYDELADEMKAAADL